LFSEASAALDETVSQFQFVHVQQFCRLAQVDLAVAVSAYD
jgi:hypothetical protein